MYAYFRCKQFGQNTPEKNDALGILEIGVLMRKTTEARDKKLSFAYFGLKKILRKKSQLFDILYILYS